MMTIHELLFFKANSIDEEGETFPSPIPPLNGG
jgi:hypothetical protein